jgi:hypothetical protein
VNWGDIMLEGANEELRPIQTVGAEDSPFRLPSIDKVQGILRRFASIRSARRALAPSVVKLQEDSAKAQGQRLRKELEQLAISWKSLGDTDTPEPDAIRAVCLGFEKVEVELSEMSDQLRLHADGVNAAQLRSTLPGIARRHRQKEVGGLLDLLIEDMTGLPGRRSTIEYLVTLLATEKESGTCKIVADPAKLTPAMQSLCDRIETEYVGVSEEYELELFEAVNLAEGSDVLAHMSELRAKKEKLGTACFLPRILRAIVTYNASVANRMSGRVATSREDDDEFENRVQEGGTPAIESFEVAPPESVSPELDIEHVESGSMHDASGIDQVREALGRRLRDLPIGNSASERVALALDVSALDRGELEMLKAVDAPNARTTASILLVGLIDAIQPVIEEPLFELGITHQQIHEDWPAELDQDLKNRISTLISSNDYEAACRLSEFKTKHLYASISSVARERRDRDGIRPRAITPESAGAKQEMVAAAREAQAELIGSETKGWVVPARKFAIGEGRGQKIRAAVAAALLVCLLVVAAVNFILAEAPDLADMGAEQLSAISPYLTTAQRSRKGSGVMVIGRVSGEWARLSEKDKIEAAQAMAGRLADQDVKDAMIYDQVYRLQIHVASGKLRRPGLK